MKQIYFAMENEVNKRQYVGNFLNLSLLRSMKEWVKPDKSQFKFWLCFCYFINLGHVN